MINKLVVEVTTIPADITKHSVAWVWPCFNCGHAMEVSARVFQQLNTSKLLGVKCPDCLRPRPNAGVVMAA